VSDLNNPFPAVPPEPVIVIDRSEVDRVEIDPSTAAPLEQEPLLPPVSDPINSNSENPPWTGFDLLLMALILMAALLVFTTIAFGISTAFSHRSVKELAKDPGTLTIVPAMAISYLVVMTFMYLRLARVRNAQFWEAVSWEWPRGNSWLGFLVLGGVTAVALGMLSRLLPMPKSLPVDRFFGDRRSAFLMVFFGVLVAPLAEELLFRGFLYPVLDRWLETSFMFPQKLQRGSGWFFVTAAWGWTVHMLPHSGSKLFGALVAVGILAIFLVWITNPKGKVAEAVTLPGVGILVWGFVVRSLPGHGATYATAALLGMTVLLLAIGIGKAWEAQSAATVGRILAVLITSAAFAMMHSDQLGSAWAPLLIVFAVGCLLTLTRVITRAVAPGVLIHMGYNGTLFGLLYIATDHFRHLERMTQ
jgi:membrane protease YdiL (CAAX protease family)